MATNTRPTSFDIIVVGGGHAGVEAAWAAAQLGADVALITMDRHAMARMSCNPAIGGLGKGQIVREVDALGGLMGVATDQAGIQFRMLNRSKGPAVWAPRAQADHLGYPRVILNLLTQAKSLTIIDGIVEAVDVARTKSDSDKPRVTGVTLADGRRFAAGAIVLTTGTFLNGLLHTGDKQTKGGRIGEPAATGLSDALRDIGLTLARLKTGTPPRVHRDTIDYDACETQPGDDLPTPFSWMTDAIRQPQISCWITWTNARVHSRIRADLHRAPLFTGQIESTGPRYCPSIEDKIVRFPEKPRHQVFLEPEGYDNERIYCNGISTSLPADVQEKMVHEINGLSHARILQHGYAVEYDFVPTDQIDVSLQTKRIAGLFLAGQINGTSGYEEAAGQGLVAGVNAIQHLAGKPPLVLGRDEAYIGVMIDDLITRPPSEPYRMFTSRAEYRLLLRADNADQRLTPTGRDLGLVDDARWARYERKAQAMSTIRAHCAHGRVGGLSLQDWLRRPEADVSGLAQALAGQGMFCVNDLDQILIDAKYSGYIRRQAQQIDRFRKLENLPIPSNVDYAAIPNLRLEAREHLARLTPATLGQAGRIPGINPADITVLWVHINARRERPRP